MRRAARAIIIHDNKLLVMHRNKFGQEYDTLPGGNVELGETPEQAVYREVAEETTVQFTNPRLTCIEHAGDPYGDQFVFLCDYQSGEPKLHPNAEEQRINALGKNLYEPRWLAIVDLPGAAFLSEGLKQFILHSSKHGWPTSAVEITTK
jgi:8-oxo-dGTP diphosphatase